MNSSCHYQHEEWRQSHLAAWAPPCIGMLLVARPWWPHEYLHAAGRMAMVAAWPEGIRPSSHGGHVVGHESLGLHVYEPP
ncbi:hypothetical protein Dimus_034117, partial [Dionaea muscipula]